ncbi:MAG: aldo/keto reductase [Candidatus Lambdaproteobacteria bacterium]|nr:aldo/keto reductase [Candidatus Lambdaproteobacteria bacterium]
MEFRTLGRNGLKVSAIGLGCMGLSGTYGASDDKAGIAVIQRALELGITFVDSSDMYGAGHNEELLGKALRGRRAGVVLATKFGYEMGPDRQIKGINGRPAHVQAACEASLKRLGTDVIDLYYQHRVDDKVPIEDTVGAMGRLVEQGKVRHLGLSEAAPETIRRAHAEHPLTAVQSEFSLLSPEIAALTRPVTQELGIGFVAYAPLGRGLLTGTIHGPGDLAEGDRRHAHPRFQADNLDHNVTLVRRIEELAAARHVKPAQLVLAWVLNQGQDVVPIPGTRRVEKLHDNIAATAIQLSAAELAHIAEVFPTGAVKGTRYPEAALAALQR